jgi:uncharacterized protein
MAKKTLQSVLIKPAGPDCNLDCSYCFYRKKGDMFGSSDIHRMSIDTLEEIVQQVMTQGPGQVSFGWQGGEPTLMGLAFFEKAVEFQKKYGRGQSVGNGLQTNGLLLDEKWAHFLRSYNFLVGLSIDGPEEIHNRYRLSRGGEGSWSRVVEAASLLLDNGVNTNVLSVINDYSVDFPEDIYRFNKGLGLNYMQFIPCLEPDSTDPARSASFSLPAEKYGDFLCTVFDLWRGDFKNGKPTTSIRYFDSLLSGYMGLGAGECTLQQECGDYLLIEHNGDVYSCDFFVEPAWRLGNIDSDLLTDMLNAPRQQQFGRQKTVLTDKCMACRWLTTCNGGCPKDRMNNVQDPALSGFCEAYQVFFDYADGELRDLAQQWVAEQAAQARLPEQKSQVAGKAKAGRNQPCPCGSGRKYKKCCMIRG